MNDIEIWADIKGFPNYEVSTHGNVRNKTTKKVLTPDINSTGYPTVRISNPQHKKVHQNIHHLVAVAFLGDPNQCVNHIDGDKTNNHVSNLEWCTYAQNNKHAYDAGLKQAWQQRISNEDRLVVADMLRSGVSIKDVAKHFKVSTACIYQLLKRKQVVL